MHFTYVASIFAYAYPRARADVHFQLGPHWTYAYPVCALHWTYAYLVCAQVRARADAEEARRRRAAVMPGEKEGMIAKVDARAAASAAEEAEAAAAARARAAECDVRAPIGHMHMRKRARGR